jgi:hypothetical protein
MTKSIVHEARRVRLSRRLLASSIKRARRRPNLWAFAKRLKAAVNDFFGKTDLDLTAFERLESKDRRCRESRSKLDRDGRS